MSRSAPRVRVRSRARPTLSVRLFGLLWRVFRILFVLGAALGPGMPPPPPPPRPAAEMQASGGKVSEEE